MFAVYFVLAMGLMDVPAFQNYYAMQVQQFQPNLECFLGYIN